MTDVRVTPSAAGWYPDPERTAASRFWDGSAWTEHTKGTAPLYAPPQPGSATPPDQAMPLQDAQRNGIATAGLVLGIVALVLDVALIPTVLALVFGGVGLSRAAARGGVGRVRAIVGLVLAVVALPVQAAIAIPVFIGVQNAAKVAAIHSDIENTAANSGVHLTALTCPAGIRPVAGERFTCDATTSTGERLLIDVVLGDNGAPTSIGARRG